MSQYLKPLTEAFERFPVGSRVLGRDGRNDLQGGYVTPNHFGVVTREGAENFGRAWITISTDAPVDGVFNMHTKATHKVWADTLTAVNEAEPKPRAVVAHLLVEITFRPGEADEAAALRLADTLVDKTLNMAKQVDRYYIRQLGTAGVND